MTQRERRGRKILNSSLTFLSFFSSTCRTKNEISRTLVRDLSTHQDEQEGQRDSQADKEPAANSITSE